MPNYARKLPDGATLQAHLDAGMKKVAIARLYGVNPDAVKVALRKHREANTSSIITPAWVPATLASDYAELAKLDGEEAAASWARQAKRGVSA